MNSKITYSVTAATIGDLVSLHQMEQACFQPDAWPLIDLIAVLSFPGITRLKAVADRKMVGFISGDAKKNENTGWITSICVHKDFQRSGIGRGLLEACEKEMNMELTRLCVRKSNQNAIHFYQLLGFNQVDIWPAYYSDKEDGLIFER